jgi:glucose-6-phosphate 1-dehydrogenase
LKLNSKKPGLYNSTLPIEMDFTYKRRFEGMKIPEAYESLILDAIRGDASNFVRDDELEVAWRVRCIQTPSAARPRPVARSN